MQQEEEEQGKLEPKEALNFSRLQEEHAKARPEFFLQSPCKPLQCMLQEFLDSCCTLNAMPTLFFFHVQAIQLSKQRIDKWYNELYQ